MTRESIPPIAQVGNTQPSTNGSAADHDTTIKSLLAAAMLPPEPEEIEEQEQQEEKQQRKKQADILVELALSRARFFTGSDGQHYAEILIEDHKEIWRLSSGAFSDWLTSIFYLETGSVPGNQAKADARALFAFMASKVQEPVFVRVAHANGRIYLDLCTDDWSAVEINTQGWRIVSNPPVNFVRTKSMLPLATPQHSTNTYALRKYINIEDEDWILIVAWIIATLHPEGPKPILALLSQAGSGKSTILRILKRLLDPAVAELRGKIGEDRDLYIAAANSWLLAFDNISYLSNDTSDALCRISTGGGFAKRQLHTDGEEHIIDVMRPVVINGIGDIMERQDLVDRSIIISTPVLPDAKRRDEKEFWEEFDQEKGTILGAFLNALSTGLRNLPNVQLDKLPRMADFAKLAVAAEPAINGSERSFIETYDENRELAAQTIVESSVLADVVKEFMKAQGAWIGTPKDLHEGLTSAANEKQLLDKEWPKSAARMKGKLERLAPALRSQGIEVRYSKSNGIRGWSIQRTDN